jgi:glutamine synthetase
MTEVMNADGTPHESNGRATIDDDGDFWFGFEQSILLWILKLYYLLVSYWWLSCPQGMYYCSVGGKHTRKTIGRRAC